MSELKRKNEAEIAKATSQMVSFLRDIDKTNRTLGRMAQTALVMAVGGGGKAGKARVNSACCHRDKYSPV